MKTNTRKLVFAALFAALACVSTMVIRIPTPTNGYVNLGDCVVLLCGWLLGPVWGVAAAAVGSMFADIIPGYVAYAPATFVIKGVLALIGFFLYKVTKRLGIVGLIISSVVAELWMVFGYFFFEATFMGLGWGAAVGIPANLVQGGVAVVLSVLLMGMLEKTHLAGKITGEK